MKSLARTAWITVFSLLFLLSLDFWAWSEGPGSGPLGIPGWVYYFMILQLLLAAAILAFARWYWTTGESGDECGEADPH